MPSYMDPTNSMIKVRLNLELCKLIYKIPKTSLSNRYETCITFEYIECFIEVLINHSQMKELRNYIELKS